MRIGTANIQNFPDHPAREVAEDAITVMRHTSVCGLQEITPGEDSDVIEEVARGPWRLIGARSTNPFLVNTRTWRVLSHNVTRHLRRKVGHRPQNPHHDIVSVVLESVKRPHLPVFAVANTHLASGGFNAEHDPAIQQLWLEEWDRYVEEVHRLRADGYSVFLVGDFNNPQPPKVTPRGDFAWLTPQRSLDHIGLLEHPDSVDMLDGEHTRVSMNSDHDLHVLSGHLDPSDG